MNKNKIMRIHFYNKKINKMLFKINKIVINKA